MYFFQLNFKVKYSHISIPWELVPVHRDLLPSIQCHSGIGRKNTGNPQRWLLVLLSVLLHTHIGYYNALSNSIKNFGMSLS